VIRELDGHADIRTTTIYIGLAARQRQGLGCLVAS